MGDLPDSVPSWTGHSTPAGGLRTPLSAFLSTETRSATVLLAATIAALAWANIDASAYETFWRTGLSLHIGAWEVAQDLRRWVNSGLMTFFFFVVGLEARREFDIGELRERWRIALPFFAAVSGMVVPAAIFLAVNAGLPSGSGWGVAISTDTAFALGGLTLLGARLPKHVRAFVLTVAVVDDFLAMAVIAFVYSERGSLLPLLLALGIFGLVLLVRAAGVRHGLVYVLLGAAAWLAVFSSGVDPIVVGLAMGLLTYAYPASRSDLERASEKFRSFREQPTAELERSARLELASAISPNERLQQLYHPWTSYLIVPLFALANAGIHFSGDSLAHAFTSPITLGILAGYVLGKPAGILGAAALVTRLSRGRVRPPVGWLAVAGGGTIAGMGFTVSLLIATLAFTGDQLHAAKVGVISSVVCAFAATWMVGRVAACLPRGVRARALLGTAEPVVDLAEPVDPDRDHLRGRWDAPVTVVEYGDFECPYCGQAEPVIHELLAGFGDVRYVWRHLPLRDVHPNAQLAAEAAEAAAEQGVFWDMHDRLLASQDALRIADLIRHAEEFGLDTERFRHALHTHAGAARIAEDVESADLSGVSGTPTFFINGRRHHGSYDIAALSAAVRTAHARTVIGP